MSSDVAERAHARRCTNRQSGDSVRGETSNVVIVAEAMHSSALTDIQKLEAVITDELSAIWSVKARATILAECSPHFEF
jgi:DNA/RNA-binding domain of Phe-tRNA-synthetase-like protein